MIQLKNLWREWKKYSYPLYVLIVLAGIVFLGFANTVLDSNDQTVTLFQLFLEQTHGQDLSDISYSGFVLWNSGIQGWLLVFAPLLLSLPYLAVLAEGRQRGQYRLEVFRMGNWKYGFTKTMSGAVFGGALFTCGYALFGVIVCRLFPAFTSFSADMQQAVFAGTVWQQTIRMLAGSFCYGFVVSIFGIGVSVFFRDRYMLLCLPFLLNYIYGQIISKLLARAYASDAQNTQWLEAFSMNQIAQIRLDKCWIVAMLVFLSAYIVITLLLVWKLKRRGWDA